MKWADQDSQSVEVPGGQQLYVGPDLALGFTPPHSGFIPTGSFTSGFSLSIHGRFGWEALDATCGKFSACPVGKPGKAPVPYQIYGQKGGNPSKEQKRHCVDIVLHANPVEELGAWEYT